VPRADLEQFSEWSHELEPIIMGGLTPAERRERAVRSLTGLERYFTDLLGHYRRSPADNLLTALSRAEEQGDALTPDEVVGTCILLLFAGHETTTNLIANGVAALDKNPAAREQLRRNPDLAVSAVEELLRFDGPVKVQVRVAIEDLEIRGRPIRSGQRVFLVLAAANRDPERFVSPDELDLTRQENDHVAFGYGIHHCLGAPLARLEAQIVFAELVRRLPTLRVAAPGPRWRETALGRGMTQLPIELSPPGEAARAGSMSAK
jgi:cytochrome P450